MGEGFRAMRDPRRRRSTCTHRERRKNIAMAAVAIIVGTPHTMITTTRVTARVGASGVIRGSNTAMCATLVSADGPTTRSYTLARSGVAARGVEDGRSVSIDRDDKKLKVYLEYTKMRALAFITAKKKKK